MNRLITSLVQLALAVPCYYGVRYMISDIKEMMKEVHND
jgi:hypothetical protein